jgi:hypothetical protein
MRYLCRRSIFDDGGLLVRTPAPLLACSQPLVFAPLLSQLRQRRCPCTWLFRCKEIDDGCTKPQLDKSKPRIGHARHFWQRGLRVDFSDHKSNACKNTPQIICSRCNSLKPQSDQYQADTFHTDHSTLTARSHQGQWAKSSFRTPVQSRTVRKCRGYRLKCACFITERSHGNFIVFTRRPRLLAWYKGDVQIIHLRIGGPTADCRRSQQSTDQAKHSSR